MTLTIFKNDDFETIGFKVTEKVYDGKFLRHEEITIQTHGIQSGWRKDVPMTKENIELTQRIMRLEAKMSILNDAMADWFKIAEENNIKHNGVNFSRIDDKKDNIKRSIEYALSLLN